MVRPDVTKATVASCIATLFMAMIGGCGTMTEDAAALFPQPGEIANSVGDVRQALDGNGYPDLRAIPKVPENLPGRAQWAGLERDLQSAGSSLNADPRATLAAEIAPPESWAGPVRARMETSPGFAPQPDWMADSRWRDEVVAEVS